jgi:hypothetical protein
MKTTFKTRKQTLRATYVIAGALLVLVWPILVAAIPLNVIYKVEGLQTVLAMGFAAVGAVLLPVGILYSSKMDRLYKFLIVLPAALLLLFLSFWITVFAVIGFHGL